MKDVAAQQKEDGSLPHVVPDVILNEESSAAWGDALTIIPWQIYLSYGNEDVENSEIKPEFIYSNIKQLYTDLQKG